jgi:hypothetical protein
MESPRDCAVTGFVGQCAVLRRPTASLFPTPWFLPALCLAYYSNTEGKYDMFFRNVGWISRDYTTRLTAISSNDIKLNSLPTLDADPTPFQTSAKSAQHSRE